MKKKETICQEADRIVSTDRQRDYAHPYIDFSRIAGLWSKILGFKIQPEQVGLCMIALKISRECNKHKRDNLVDIAGYAKTIDMVMEKEKYRKKRRKVCTKIQFQGF